jgi:N-glycosylase/DNA lyase
MKARRHAITVDGPLDLDLTLTCGQAFRWRSQGAGAWSGVVGGAELRVEARDGELCLEVLGEDPGLGALVRYFRLDEHPESHLVHAAGLRDIPGFTELLGMRLLRQEPWETLVSFICSAASNVRKISGGVEGMAERWGKPIPGSDRRAFPGPERLASLRERDLRSLGIGFRAPYVLATAGRLAREPWDWEALRRAPLEEARGRLQELPGVGPKIADCVLLFGLDRLDTYPVDRWIRRATLELTARRTARDEDLERWSRALGPSRGYLQQILFHLRRTGGPFEPLPRTSGIPSMAPSPRARRRTAS